MCTGGRIVNHLVQGLGHGKNDLLFVGYQASGTPGRNILKYCNRPNGYVWLEQQKVMIKAKVHQLTGYSAHADQNNLVDWVNAMERRPNEIRLVHGDANARTALAHRLGL